MSSKVIYTCDGCKKQVKDSLELSCKFVDNRLDTHKFGSWFSCRTRPDIELCEECSDQIIDLIKSLTTKINKSKHKPFQQPPANIDSVIKEQKELDNC